MDDLIQDTLAQLMNESGRIRRLKLKGAVLYGGVILLTRLPIFRLLKELHIGDGTWATDGFLTDTPVLEKLEVMDEISMDDIPMSQCLSHVTIPNRDNATAQETLDFLRVAAKTLVYLDLDRARMQTLKIQEMCTDIIPMTFFTYHSYPPPTSMSSTRTTRNTQRVEI